MVRKTQTIRNCLWQYLDILERVAGDNPITHAQSASLDAIMNIITEELDRIDADYDEIPGPEGETSRA